MGFCQRPSKRPNGNRCAPRLTMKRIMDSTTATGSAIDAGPESGFACPASRMSDPLTLRLKTLIVQTLKLDDVRPEEIPDDEPLIGSPRYGLDSIDALELVVKLEKEFGVKISSSEES